MKRWIALLGRGGTVLISLALALFLVSLIPPVSFGTFGGSDSVEAGLFKPLSYFEYTSTLTPKQALKMKLTFNGTLDVYLLEVSTQALYDWIHEYHPEQQMMYPAYNVTMLEEFLISNPNSISLQEEMREGEIQYAPTKVTNATLILSNPSSDFVTVEYDGTVTIAFAPENKVRNLALWTIPIGFVCALPWLIRTRRTKVTQ